MQKKPTEIRVILASNIRKRRKLLGLSQEALSEMVGISSTMVRDIEACRTWISDTTLTNLAVALKTDIFCLFMAEDPSEGVNNQTVLLELTKTLNGGLRTPFLRPPCPPWYSEFTSVVNSSSSP